MAEKFGIKYEDSKVKKQGGLDREILEWIQEKEGGIANEYLYFNECSISEKGIQVIVKDNKDTVIIFSLSLALEKCQKENEYDQIVLIAKQLQEMFPKICGVDKYQYDINGGDYTIDGRQKWRIAFVLKKESVEEKNIINYNFHRIEVSLDEKMIYLETYCQEHPHFSFRELLERQGSKVEIIVTFLAMLEFMKTGRIRIVQEQLFDEIYITVCGQAISDVGRLPSEPAGSMIKEKIRE